MKKISLITIFIICTITSFAQSRCRELMETIKEKGYGTTYSSDLTSDAISKVTFYEITVDYNTLYFAIVCFKREYSYECSEYLYQVGSNTKYNYSMNYMQSAGKAFWKFIEPYNKNLKCGAKFE